MTKIQKIVPLFLVALFTAGVMAAGQSVAASSSSSDCVTAKKDVNNMTEQELARIYDETRDN